MTAEMHKKRMKLLAELDVRAEEVIALIEKREEILKQKAETKKKNLLKFGPEGSGFLSDGILIEIDGQACQIDRKGVLRISEPESPFYGMKITDYRKFVCEPWRVKNRQILKEKTAKAKLEKKPFTFYKPIRHN
jgi:hypothetical protein